ncbi:MAG: 4-hydroxy-3-methylbut-2-enyl diphosphate reductase, partial [Oscillospiraceae bacterium]|nr:4-hydroxy-3-methylbut-2-enyl diphosphate reductase [Oscillospiraceae bacterium]
MSGAEGYSRIVGPRRLSVCGSAGFCFGVGRAVDMAMSLTEALPEVYCAGPLVHNGRVLEELQARGLRIAGDLSEVPPNAHILIRSHGASRELRQSLEGRPVTDATCPCVARIHDIVRRAGPDTHILMLGDPEHPEVRATASWCRSVSVFDGPEALETLSRAHPEWESMSLIAVAQTTASLVLWEVCVDFLKKAYTNAQILDTICHATSMRQQEAAAMSAQTDVMFVVGDRKSSNTNRLAGVCERAVLIQSADELDGYRSEILSSGHIGITAGASTPASTIKEVVEKMTEEMKKAEQAAGPETTREIAAPAEDAAAAENLDPAEEAAPAEETVSAETEPVAAPDAVDP